MTSPEPVDISVIAIRVSIKIPPVLPSNRWAINGVTSPGKIYMRSVYDGLLL